MFVVRPHTGEPSGQNVVPDGAPEGKIKIGRRIDEKIFMGFRSPERCLSDQRIAFAALMKNSGQTQIRRFAELPYVKARFFAGAGESGKAGRKFRVAIFGGIGHTGTRVFSV